MRCFDVKMQPKDIKCSKCTGEMHPGYVHDVHRKDLISGDIGQQQTWVAHGGARLPVTTYACVDCGYLESYVMPPTQSAGGE
jgi:hypothetical protein